MCKCEICNAVTIVESICLPNALKYTFIDMLRFRAGMTLEDSDYLIKYIFLKMLDMAKPSDQLK